MTRIANISFISYLILAVSTSATCSAADFFVDTSLGAGQTGGFYGPYDPAEDPPPGYPLTIAADNDPTFQNYFLGRTTTLPLSSGFTTPERRAFFMFDMSTVMIPAGETITSVSIDLDVLFGGVLANFVGGVEFVDFSSTPYTAPEILDPAAFAVDPILIWDSFGTSAPYGAFDIFDAASPTPTIPDRYTIPLPGATADVAAAVGAGDIFIVTARLTSFDPGPIGAGAPPAIDPYEFVFGLTDVVVGGVPTGLEPPELIITTTSIVPEPSTSCLTLLIAGFSLAGRRRLRN